MPATKPPEKICPIMSQIVPVPGQINAGIIPGGGNGGSATVSFPLIKVPCLRSECQFWNDHREDCDQANGLAVADAVLRASGPDL